MRNLSVLILVVVIVVVLALFLFSFQVRETEVAVVTRFREPVRTYVGEPGWKLKWPSPIERVYTFDARNRLYERTMEQTTTAEANPIIVTSYAIWRVGDPIKFLENVNGDYVQAERHLYSLLGNSQNTVVGRHSFSDFVNADPDQCKFDQIEQEMLEGVKDIARDKYGMEVVAVGIKQLAINESTTAKVFDRMKKDRQGRAETIRGQGRAEATKIESDAEAKRTELLAIVEAQAKAIRGQADAEAARHYEKLEQNADLAMFLRDLEALKKILQERSTIVLGTDVAPLRLLREMPDVSTTSSPKNDSASPSR